jgi:hypothetical protein
VSLDGRDVRPKVTGPAIRIRAGIGRHRLVVHAADYQETKNMEDVARILPNTATLRTAARVR